MQTVASSSQYLTDMHKALDEVPLDAIERFVTLLIDAAAKGRTVFLIGNGGSAATASHFACDLAKGTRSPAGRRLRVVALTDNVPLITAWGNDVAYEDVFAEQLRSLCQPNDILVAISASGNSPNILQAVRVARDANATVVALTSTGGLLGPGSDLWIATPASCIEQIEDMHLIVQHLVCCQVRERL